MNPKGDTDTTTVIVRVPVELHAVYKARIAMMRTTITDDLIKHIREVVKQ